MNNVLDDDDDDDVDDDDVDIYNIENIKIIFYTGQIF